MKQETIEKLSFEDALQKLEEIVRQLETGKVSLEETIDIYEKGEALRKRCTVLLKEAKLKVQKLQADPETGELSLVEFDETKA